MLMSFTLYAFQTNYKQLFLHRNHLSKNTDSQNEMSTTVNDFEFFF